MTSPKHLWSGNWEDESSPQDEFAERRVTPSAPEPSASPPQPEPTRPKRRRRAWIAVGALTVVVVAVALALTTLGGSSKPRPTPASTVPAAPSLAATTPTTVTPPPASPRPVNWLGMELVTLPSGAEAVETVRAGSQGDRAGLSPGDVILEINNRAVRGADGIAEAIRGLHAGDRVAMQISHGSSLYETEVTLGAPPTPYP
jgi:S1-C subfamily serine protease